VAGHHLQHHRERPGIGDRVRVGHHVLGGVPTALHAVAADGVLALRCEPDVRHHRDAGAGDRGDLVGHPPPALELHGVTAALLHEPHRRAQGLGRALLVRAERQVPDHQRVPGRPDHGADQREQLLLGHRHGRLVPEDVVGRRVADQQHRDADPVEQGGGVLVVRGEHRPLLAALLGGEQVAGAHPAGGRAPVQRLDLV
jgi:hypothetical protein